MRRSSSDVCISPSNFGTASSQNNSSSGPHGKEGVSSSIGHSGDVNDNNRGSNVSAGEILSVCA